MSEYNVLLSFVYNKILLKISAYLKCKINNFEIHCGQNKLGIESKFGKGSYYENTGNGAISYYSLTDYREMEIMYDENNIVKSIYLGYVNPE